MTEKELKNFLSSAEEAGSQALEYLKSDNLDAYSLGLRRMEKFLKTLKENSSVFTLQNFKKIMQEDQASQFTTFSTLIIEAEIELKQLKTGKRKVDEIQNICKILDFISRANVLAEMSENLIKIKSFLNLIFPAFKLEFNDNELIKSAIIAGLITGLVPKK